MTKTGKKMDHRQDGSDRVLPALREENDARQLENDDYQWESRLELYSRVRTTNKDPLLTHPNACSHPLGHEDGAK